MNAPRARPQAKAQGVSLICVDCRYPRLALRALVKSLDQCEFEGARLLTDDVRAVAEPDSRIEVVQVRRIASASDYSHFILKELLHYVATDHVQVVQWDGYVIRGSAWTPEFRQWDYIGARWWFRPEGSNVGNGGFSLRSRRLLEALQDEDIVADDNEDTVIGVSARDRLESRHGIRIAPAVLADRYSFEDTRPSGAEFGFHRLSNLPYLMAEEELAATLGEISDSTFCGEAAVGLVAVLAAMGRRREALGYAQRLRGNPRAVASMPGHARRNLEQAVQGLVPRVAPCLCGSGKSYRRCCGELARWSSV